VLNGAVGEQVAHRAQVAFACRKVQERDSPEAAHRQVGAVFLVKVLEHRRVALEGHVHRGQCELVRVDLGRVGIVDGLELIVEGLGLGLGLGPGLGLGVDLGGVILIEVACPLVTPCEVVLVPKVEVEDEGTVKVTVTATVKVTCYG
jgi:hypothetical protein